MKQKLLVTTIVITILVVTLITLVSAVRLNTGTILNATTSNSTMTFTIPIDVDSATVGATSITLTNIQCSNGATSTDTNLVWNTPNANRDSAYYCALGCSNQTMTGFRIVMLIASVMLIGFVSLFVWNKYQNGTLTVKDMIILFIVIIVAIALWLSSGQNLGEACGVLNT